MSGTVRMEQECLEGYASSMEGLALEFEEYPLDPSDDNSTITANEKEKTAYSRARADANLLAVAIRNEAENMRSIGLEFGMYDTLLAWMSLGK